MNISRLKIHATDVHKIVGYGRGNTPPTDNELQDFFKYINKPIEKLTSRQQYIVREIVNKQIDYDPNGFNAGIKKTVLEMYAFQMFDKGTLSGGGTKPHTLDKGRLAEPAAIQLLSKHDGVEYIKNTKVFSNSYFRGKPDIVIYDEKNKPCGIKEIKIPYDFPSFLWLLEEPISKQDSWQMQAYMDILKLDSGEVCYCLVNMPEIMLMNKINELVDKCIELGMDNDEIGERREILISNMTYQDIPEELKVNKFSVYKDAARVKEATARVRQIRKWLKGVDELFRKPLTLKEIENP